MFKFQPPKGISDLSDVAQLAMPGTSSTRFNPQRGLAISPTQKKWLLGKILSRVSTPKGD
jgi:hypothetical protein